jgi:hypothetical protein
MKRMLFATGMAALCMMLCSCETTGYGSQYNDPFAGFMSEVNHSLAPAAAQNAYRHGAYNQGNQIRATDSFIETMNNWNRK